jgi:alpha-amylase
MNKIYLLMGIHNHQPIGNFEHVFSESYDKCYHPSLEALSKRPGLKFAIHHSGPLLEWMEKNKPAYIELLGGMVESGQVEILSGGFYEPILSSLSEKDAVGQVEMMNRWIEERFGVRPRGAWLAERIWDPYMPKILASAGIEYTLLDDTHFYYAGLGEKDMYGYWVTEKHGSPLAVFPIDKTMRYSIPFKQPEESLKYFQETAARFGTTGISYGDDGEKFGVWPETHEWVFGKKWLERFLTMLDDNQSVVETTTFSGWMDMFPPKGRIYLPMASYEEMMHWTLPTDVAIEHTNLVHKLEKENRVAEFKKFLRGGVFDNFLTKYDEANRLHKHMLYTSRRVAKALEKPGKAGAADAMTAALYRGQCNCPYWHGLFGGIYLSNLRHAVYTNIIDAGKQADAALHRGKSWVELNHLDFFTQMRKDVVVETRDLFALITPYAGGSVAEIDFKPSSFNLSNVMTRRREEYHQKILDAVGKSDAAGGEILSIHDRVVFKEKSLEKKLVFDEYTRQSFMEHILLEKPSIEDFRSGKTSQNGSSTKAEYTVTHSECKGGTAKIVLSRDAGVPVGATTSPVYLRKTYEISGATPEISCEISVTNRGKQRLDFFLCVEWNFTLLAADALDRYIMVNSEKYMMNQPGSNKAVKKWSLTDEYFKLRAEFASGLPVELLRYPIETVSQSEGGFESNYQGTCLIAVLPVSIGPGESKAEELTLTISKL